MGYSGRCLFLLFPPFWSITFSFILFLSFSLLRIFFSLGLFLSSLPSRSLAPFLSFPLPSISVFILFRLSVSLSPSLPCRSVRDCAIRCSGEDGESKVVFCLSVCFKQTSFLLLLFLLLLFPALTFFIFIFMSLLSLFVSWGKDRVRSLTRERVASVNDASRRSNKKGN